MNSPLHQSLLRKNCVPSDFTEAAGLIQKTDDHFMGQERAVRSIKLGIGLKASGFNIYASGISGSGRLTAVKTLVTKPAAVEATPDDWCYVNNFKEPYQPLRLRMPAGKATLFKNDMKNLIRDALTSLVKAFESEEYAIRRKKIIDAFQRLQMQTMDSLNEKAAQESFGIKQTPWDIIAIPLKDDHPISDEDFNQFSASEQERIHKKQEELVELIKDQLGILRKKEKEANKDLRKLEHEIAVITISSLIEEITEHYQDLPQLLDYFVQVKEDILDNLPEFLMSNKASAEGGMQQLDMITKRYFVNVLVDNSNQKGAPVIIETNPSYSNLLGRVEKESYMGTLLTDFTMIRKGSLHSANGGYLILRVEELLNNYFSWNGLKRALKNKEIVIEEASEQLGLMTTRTLKPEPIPLDVKVILIGNPLYYHLLYAYDPDFRTLFKVKADFDTEMIRNAASIQDYKIFIETISQKEGLLTADISALSKLVEYGSRLISDQQKLSTRFDIISDILHEANYYAKDMASEKITELHISKAVEEKVYRSNLIQEKINEMIVSRQIFIDIAGKKTGQVNGLAVTELGDFAFGRPSRITCSISLGKEGIIAVEREAELSGPIHSKGVMILTGYLMEKYVRERPFSLTARLVFEQSYSEIEGDSASSAELYTILSNLSGVPIQQGIAVTGSVNQRGEVQAIGGVNEKIEGYFEVCKRIGLNGEQGVLIPKTNIRNLMLKEEVLDAVSKGQFNIWAVETIDEGIEILTGIPAGNPGQSGSICYLVQQALEKFATQLKEFSATAAKDEKSQAS